MKICMNEFCGSVPLFVLQVQIRPWNLNDSDFVMDGSQPLDPRKTIFVGGVPRPLRAGTLILTPGWGLHPCHHGSVFSVGIMLVFMFCHSSGTCYDHGPSVWRRMLCRD